MVSHLPSGIVDCFLSWRPDYCLCDCVGLVRAVRRPWYCRPCWEAYLFDKGLASNQKEHGLVDNKGDVANLNNVDDTAEQDEPLGVPIASPERQWHMHKELLKQQHRNTNTAIPAKDLQQEMLTVQVRIPDDKTKHRSARGHCTFMWAFARNMSFVLNWLPSPRNWLSDTILP